MRRSVVTADLKDVFLFSKLTDEQLQRVGQMAQEIHLQEGEALFAAGDLASRFFVVISGQIKLYRLAPNGNEKVIEVITPSNVFAEAVMFSEQPTYPVNSEAIEETQLMAINNRQFLVMLRESPDTCFSLLRDMSLRLRHLIDEIDNLALQSATGRIAGFFCSKFVFEGQDLVEFDLNTPKGVLASRLSVKPETFSRILHSLTDDGVVEVSGGHIRILNPTKLREIAQLSGACAQAVNSPD